jgi:hypothetical protein
MLHLEATPFRLICAAVLLSSAALAQRSFVSPPAAASQEGSGGTSVSFTATTSRTMQIDANLIGRSWVVFKQLAFRRDTDIGNSAAIPRSVTVQIDFGIGDMAQFGRYFDQNYVGPKTTVFTPKQVMLPDWSQPITGLPAFDLVFKFDQPYIHTSTNSPILWDLICTSGSIQGAYYMDWQSGPFVVASAPQPETQGQGCVTSQGRFALTSAHEATSSTLSLRWAVQAALPQSPVLMLFGIQDPQLALPGLCASLHSDLALPIALLGQSDASGSIPMTTLLSAPWNSAFAGLPTQVQALCLDATQPGLPFVLSNGLQSPLPLVPGQADLQVLRIYSNKTTGPIGTTPSKSAAPVEYGG